MSHRFRRASDHYGLLLLRLSFLFLQPLGNLRQGAKIKSTRKRAIRKQQKIPQAQVFF